MNPHEIHEVAWFLTGLLLGAIGITLLFAKEQRDKKYGSATGTGGAHKESNVKLEIHHYHHSPNEERIMALLDNLNAADTALTASVVAMLAYVHTIPQQISDAVAAAVAANPGIDTTQLDALAADVKSQADALNAALPQPVAAAATTAAAAVNADPAPTTAATVTAAASDAVAADASAPTT